MDMNNVTLVMDIWEGRPYLNMPTIYKDGGVRGMIVRMNDTFGTLHNDEYFQLHWATSEYFYRIPYFVFWPGYKAIDQYNWIIKNLPQDVKVIAIDVELNCKWTNPLTVAQILDDLVFKLQEHGLKVIVYSGDWWWKEVDDNGNRVNIAQIPAHDSYEYWWASYPYLLQPDNTHTYTTWDNLRKLISQVEWNVKAPGDKFRLWQICSRYILPGTGGQNVDINVFKGTPDELKQFFGGHDATPLPPPQDGLSFVAECLVQVQNVRKGPGIGFDVVGTISLGQENPVLGIQGKEYWIKIGESAGVERWVAGVYGGTKYQNIRAV